jgi:hypothetical protein
MVPVRSIGRCGKRPLRFGIKTYPQFTTYENVLRVWREADEIPSIEHAGVFDHFVPRVSSGDPVRPVLECWTLLAALAAQTSRLRLGVMVTGNTFRHPPVSSPRWLRRWITLRAVGWTWVLARAGCPRSTLYMALRCPYGLHASNSSTKPVR